MNTTMNCENFPFFIDKTFNFNLILVISLMKNKKEKWTKNDNLYIGDEETDQ